MAFHLLCELPKVETKRLDEQTQALTSEEARIIKLQIRGNSLVIQADVQRLELYLNKEKYPKDASFIEKIRHNLKLSMEENDTFRKVLWRHYQSLEACRQTPGELP